MKKKPQKSKARWKVCIACEGKGTSSKGKECVPCRGKGRLRKQS